jgi:hypothetical protein
MADWSARLDGVLMSSDRRLAIAGYRVGFALLTLAAISVQLGVVSRDVVDSVEG